jgi:hypothetical protein
LSNSGNEEGQEDGFFCYTSPSGAGGLFQFSPPVTPEKGILVDLTRDDGEVHVTPLISLHNKSPEIEQAWKMRKATDHEKNLMAMEVWEQCGGRPSSQMRLDGKSDDFKTMLEWFPDKVGVALKHVEMIKEDLALLNCAQILSGNGTPDNLETVDLRKERFFYIALNALELSCRMLCFGHCGPDDPWYHKWVAINLIKDDLYGCLASRLLEKEGNPQGPNPMYEIHWRMQQLKKRRRTRNDENEPLEG